ncbi:hypothetical protein SOPP22_01340 [Shewanella sp. OPT22]|nr:hypothetical protein SOPP22_01340 [Shewanella sp. OPT22]
MLKQWIVVLSFISALFLFSPFSHSSQGQEYQNYDVYYDENGDIVLRIPPKFLLIASEIAIPLSITPKNGVFRLTYQNGKWVMQPLTQNQFVQLSLTLATDIELEYQDIDGDGVLDLIVRSGHSSRTSFTVSNLSGTAQLNAYSIALNGIDLSRGSNLSYQDINNDGITDIRVGDTTYLSSRSGKLLSLDKLNSVLYEGTVIGLSAGEFKVTEQGSSSYSIPITVPPGTAGVAPQIALSYNSMSSEGVMGMGWNISGMSAITRCPRSIAHDGYIKGVQFDESDAFCLNGQRLKQNANSTTKYHTDIDSFSVIESHTATGFSGPRYFSVTTKANETHYYGAAPDFSGSDDAFVERGGFENRTAAKVWALKAIVDHKGNYIQYDYDKNTEVGSHYLSEISYGGNTETNQSNYNRVVFGYKNNSKRSFSGYSNGGKIFGNKYLDYIRVYQDSDIFRYYTLSWERSSEVVEDRNYVKGIQECFDIDDNEPRQCLPATTFEYQYPERKFGTTTYQLCEFRPEQKQVVCYDTPYCSAEDNDGTEFCKINNDVANFQPFSTDSFLTANSNSDRHYTQVFDFNGDGFADIVYPKSGKWNVYTSDWEVTTQTITAPQTQLKGNTKLERGLLDDVGVPRTIKVTNITGTNKVITNSSLGEKEYVRVIDYDGDGKQELLVPIKSGNWHILTSDPSSSEQQYCEDLNTQDNKIQSYTVENRFCETHTVNHDFTYKSLSRAATGYKNAVVADVDGDGLQDIVFKSGSLKYYKNLGGSFSAAKNINLVYTDGFSGSIDLPFEPRTVNNSVNLKNSAMVDINGDGLTDIIMKVTKTTYDDPPGCDKRFIAGDDNFINGPGNPCAPIVSTERRTYAYIASVNNGDVTYTAKSYLGSSLPNMRLADLNGDGLTDILFTSSEVWNYRLSYGDGRFQFPKVITGINAKDEHIFNRHQFVDLDADGRADILGATDSASYRIIMSAPSNTPDSLNLIDRGYLSLGNVDINKTALRLADVDGDTKLDLLTASSDSGKWQVRKATRPYIKEHLLTKITNGFGVETTLAYAPLNSGMSLLDMDSSQKPARSDTDFSDYLTPFAGYYVVTEAASQSSNNADDAPTLVQYRYGGPLAHKKGHGFLGFETLQTVDPQSSVITTTKYHQLYPFTGMPSSTIKSYQDLILSEAVNQYEEKVSAQGGVQVFLKSTTEKTFSVDLSSDGETPANHKKVSETLTTNNYDNWGNLTSNSISIKDAGGDLIHKTDTINSYNSSAYAVIDSMNTLSSSLAHTNQVAPQSGSTPDAKQFGRLYQTSVTKKRYKNTENNQTSSQTRVSRFSYYDNGMLRESSINGLNTAYFYDLFGNKVAQSVSAVKNEQGQKDYRRSYMAYDSRGQYLANKTNHNGDTETYLYNGQSGTGTISGRIFSKTTTGPNRLATTSFFDVQGQAIRQVMADGNYLATSREICNSCDVNFITETVSSSNKPTQKVLIDRFGRQRQQRSQSFSAEIKVDTTYDNLGRVLSVSAPYSGSSPVAATQRVYDKLGRVYREISPSESGTTSVSTIIDGLITTIIDEKELEYKDTYSADGKLITRTDPENQTINYYYDAFGNSRKVVTKALNHAGVAKEQTISTYYDDYGRKTQTNDPDKGLWTYKYNGFGELIKQTDARQQSIYMSYDSMGRMVSRKDNTNLSCWAYGNNASLYNRGKPLSIKQWSNQSSCSTTAGTEYTEHYFYDDYGRPNRTDFVLNGSSYSTKIEYNSLGQISRQHYPSNNGTFYVDYHYNSNHFLSSQRDSSGRILRNINAMDVFGNITDQNFANGTQEIKQFDEKTGRIDTIDLKRSGSFIHQLSYGQFDEKGNVTSRTHSYFNAGTLRLGFNESFEYDDLNRLAVRRLDIGKGALTPYGSDGYVERYSYDGFGNIKSRQYDGVSHKHADYNYVNSGSVNRLDSAVVDGKSYSKFHYDDNGNTTSDGSRTFTYNGFDKANRISQGSAYTEYQYNHNRSVFNRVDYRQDENIWKRYVTHYIGGIYQNERRFNDSVLENTKHKYIVGNIIVERNQSSITGDSENVQYQHSDHQGSVLSITSQNGSVLEQYFYTAFGKPMKLQGESLVQARLPMLRGYTGHEMLPSLDIIQMGGRIYDPNLARFLQADPNIQAPKNLQNYNRYSYVLNNPLTYTDPSGYFFKKLFKFIKKYWRTILAVVVSIYLPGAITALTGVTNTIALGAMTGFVAGGIATGSLRGALVGAFTGAMFGSLHYMNKGPLKILAHGTAGGISNVLNGGKFGHGFLTAGLTQALGKIKGIFKDIPKGFERVKNAIKSAIIGGTLSKLTGGKFANGALTAAFSRLLNDDLRGRSAWNPLKRIRQKHASTMEPRYDKAGNVELDQNGDIVFQSQEGILDEKVYGEMGAVTLQCQAMQKCTGELVQQSPMITNIDKPHFDLAKTSIDTVKLIGNGWFIQRAPLIGFAAYGAEKYINVAFSCGASSTVIMKCDGQIKRW